MMPTSKKDINITVTILVISIITIVIYFFYSNNQVDEYLKHINSTYPPVSLTDSIDGIVTHVHSPPTELGLKGGRVMSRCEIYNRNNYTFIVNDGFMPGQKPISKTLKRLSHVKKNALSDTLYVWNGNKKYVYLLKVSE